jgi:hypothetical protein
MMKQYRMVQQQRRGSSVCVIVMVKGTIMRKATHAGRFLLDDMRKL